MIGVCIGGDRTSGYFEAKQRLFRSLDALNPDPRLADFEAEIMRTANTLGVGPMEFGGKISLIGCKVGVQNRLPASFFVSIAYDCWAYRSLGVTSTDTLARLRNGCMSHAPPVDLNGVIYHCGSVVANQPDGG